MCVSGDRGYEGANRKIDCHKRKVWLKIVAKNAGREQERKFLKMGWEKKNATKAYVYYK